MTAIEIKAVRTKIITDFEKFVSEQYINELNKDYWRPIDEIAKLSGTTSIQVRTVIDSYDDFVKNRYGNYTTRKLYRKYTPFLERLIHANQDKIE
jgi:hypothetical protein